MNADRNDLRLAIAAVYGPRFEADYGMTFEGVSDYVGTHGHLPPMVSGPGAGVLGCSPHLFCSHECCR